MSTSTRTESTLTPQEDDLIIQAIHWDPFQVLGPHAVEAEGKPAVAVQIGRAHV